MALYSLLGALAGSLAGWASGLAWVGTRPWRLALFTCAGALAGVFAVPLAQWLLHDASPDALLAWTAATLIGVLGAVALLNALVRSFETDTTVG